MATSCEIVQHRRPALIPADAHLSAEDEESLLKRIGAVQLTTPRTYASDISRPRTKSTTCTSKDNATIKAPQGWTSNCGTKRKASTSPEQLQLKSSRASEAEDETETKIMYVSLDMRSTTYEPCGELNGATTTQDPLSEGEGLRFDDIEQVSPRSTVACMGTSVKGEQACGGRTAYSDPEVMNA